MRRINPRTCYKNLFPSCGSLSRKLLVQFIYTISMLLQVFSLTYAHAMAYRGGSTPPPTKCRSFDKAEPNSQFCGKYIRNNLIRIWLSLICKLSGPLTSGLPPPHPRSLCPLSSNEFVETPQKKIPGYAIVLMQRLRCSKINATVKSNMRNLCNGISTATFWGKWNLLC
jgi:hypothetical protein